MRRTLLSAASVFAILAGTALAQNSTSTDTSQGQAPAATAPAPAKPMAPPEKMGTANGGTTAETGSTGTSAEQTITPPANADSGTMAKQPADTGSTTAQQPATDQGAGQAAQQPMAPAGTSASDSQTAASEQPAGPPVSAKDIIGQKVYGSDGKSLGEVSDAVVDSSTGKIEKLVISSGGFLGLGAKTIALDMSEVTMAPGEGIKARGVTQNEVENMPEFKVAQATQSLDPTASGTVAQ